jgi:hypothetical protein
MNDAEKNFISTDVTKDITEACLDRTRARDLARDSPLTCIVKALSLG